jgi:hypothetical protein
MEVKMAVGLPGRYEYASLWLLAVLAVVPRTDAAFDSDLTVTCGQNFAVFDRIVQNGRLLHVVPWVREGELGVAGTVDMPGTQPHQWSIHDEHVVVRAWNDLYVYRVDRDFQPRLIHSRQIDERRPNVGGTVAIDVSGSMVRAYGVERMIALDLGSCAEQCESTVAAAQTPPPEPAPLPRCEIHVGDRLYALTVAETRAPDVIYHDLFLTRRRTDPTGHPISEAFEPESILFLGTRIETGSEQRLSEKGSPASSVSIHMMDH